jgi:hypothetical protein
MLVTVRQSSPVQQQIIQPSREDWRSRGRSGGVQGGSFTPPRMVVKDGKASTNVTFAEPGMLRRAYADDGVVFSDVDFHRNGVTAG